MIQKSTLKAWDKFMDSSDYLLRPIENDKHYDEVAGFLDSLLEQPEPSASTEALIDLIPQAVLSQLLNGKRKFSVNHAKKLAELFSVSTDVFL